MPKLLLNIPDDLSAEIEDYRKACGLKSTAEAIRSLVGMGLSHNQKPVEPSRDFERIKAGLKEAVAIAKGEADPTTYRIHNVQPIDPDKARVLHDLGLGPQPTQPGTRLKETKSRKK